MTKKEVADLLQVSSKSVENFAAAGKLQSAKRKQTGRPDAAVYHPGDVVRLREERDRELAPHAVARIPEAHFSQSSPTSQTLPVYANTQMETALIAVLREQFQKPAETHFPFVTIKEASAITRLSQVYIRKCVTCGKLEGIQDGRRLWIRRRDLEGL